MDTLPPIVEDNVESQTLPPINEDEVTTNESFDTKKEKAKRFSFAVGGDFSKENEFLAFLNSNLERNLRESMAVSNYTEQENRKLSIITDLSSKPNLDDSEKQLLSGLIKSGVPGYLIEPETIFEQKYANMAINSAISLGNNPVVERAFEEDPQAVESALSLADNNIAIREVAHGISRELADTAKQQSWGGWGLDVAATLLPFYESYRLQSALGETLPDTYFFEGELRTDYIDKLFSMPVAEAKVEITRIVNELKENNLLIARYFVDSLLKYSTNERFMGNAFAVVDAASIASPVAKAAVKGTMLAASLGTMAIPSLANGLNALGNGPAAASAVLSRRMTESVAERAAKDPFKLYEEFSLVAPEAFTDAQRIANGQFAVGSPAYTRMKNALDRAELASNSILTARQNQRTTQEAFDIAVTKTLEEWKTRNTSLDPVSNMRLEPVISMQKVVRPEDTLENVGYIKVRLDEFGIGFTDPQTAKNWAKYVLKLDEDDVDVVQWGQNFFVDYRMPVKESFDEVSEALITGDNVYSENISDWVVSALRNPSQQYSKELNARLKRATHLPSYMVNMLKEMSSPLNAVMSNPLRKKESKALERVLTENQKRPNTIIDPITGNTRTSYGHLNQTQLELDNNYMNVVGRLPSEAESMAYWSFKQISDLDWKLRNISLYKEKATKGFKNISFPFTQPVNGGGTRNIDVQLEGIPHVKVPSLGKGKEFTIAEINPSGGLQVRRSHNVDRSPVGNFNDDLVEMQRKIDEEGYSLIEIGQPNTRPLKSIGTTDERIDFILVPQHSEKNLRLNQVNYNPNHWQYKKSRYVQQAGVSASASGVKTTKSNTYIVASTDAEASRFSQHMEEARKLYLQHQNNRNPQTQKAFEDYVIANLPDNPAFLANKYEPEFDVNGQLLREAEWDINSPWTHVGYGDDVAKMTADALKAQHGDALRFGDDFEYDAMGDIDKKFLGEKTGDLREVSPNARSTRMASIIDPIESLSDGMRNVIRGRVMDDTKKFAINSWIEEFGSLLDVPMDVARKNPTYYFHNGNLNKNATDAFKLKKAEISKKNIENFLGVYNDNRRSFDLLRNRLADSVYTRLGQRAADVLTDSQLMQTKDPFKFARGFAFHTKMGFFNPIHYLMGAQTVYHSALIVGDPKIALKGAGSYGLSRALSINPDPAIRASINSVAKKMGWSGDDFLESHDAMKKAGIDLIEGENAMWDNFADYSLFSGPAGSFLDKGLMFFREGDRTNRVSAWHMSFLEWRKANPNAKLNQKALDQILNRQEILTNNMTRKSSAPIQQGAYSMATQFYGWQMRMTENFIGTQLTVKEKARLLTGYMAMYGIPVGGQAAAIPLNIASAITQTAGATPWKEGGVLGGSTDFYADIKEYALRNNLSFDEPFFKLLMDGLGGTFFNTLTGKDTNISARMGPGAFRVFTDTVEGRLELVNLAASSSIIADTYSNSMPLLKTLYNNINGNPKPGATFDNTIRALSTISTLNNTMKAYAIYSSGMSRSRTGRITQKELDGIDAAIAALGISRKEQELAFSQLNIMKQDKDTVNALLKEHAENVAKFLQYEQSDPAKAKEFGDIADEISMVILDLDPKAGRRLLNAWNNDDFVTVLNNQFERSKLNQQGTE